MELLDGQSMARLLLDDIRKEVLTLSFTPVFCDVLVGDDPVSEQYVRMKEIKAKTVGMEVYHARFSRDITTEELISEIKKINQKENMCGLIVQLPLPEHLDTQAVLDAIDPAIDVDVLGNIPSKKFYEGTGDFVFPTAAAVIFMLESLGMDLTQKKIVMVGQGRLVGRPVSYLLQKKGLAVEAVTSKTNNPESITQNADIVITAVGKENFIKDTTIKQGSIIIDAGTSEEDGNVVGDVDRDSVSKKASHLSPTPGGVGPLTVAMLFKNVLLSALKKS